jgi:hypothetical protein
MGIVDGNCRVEIYRHLLDPAKNRSEKCNFRSLAGIEPLLVRCHETLLTYIKFGADQGCQIADLVLNQ